MGDILLSLAYDFSVSTAPGRLREGSGNNARYHIAQPPGGCPIVSLENIEIKLNFAGCHTGLAEKTLGKSEGTAESQDDIYPQFDEEFCDLEQFRLSQPTGSRSIIDIDEVDLGRSSFSQPTHLRDDPVHLNRIDVDTDDSGWSRLPHSSDKSSGTGEPESSVGNHHNAGLAIVRPHADLDMKPLLALFDVAIRRFISVKQVGIDPDIRMLRNPSTPGLAEISPVLFSPGYLRVSQTTTSGVHRLASVVDPLDEGLFSTRTFCLNHCVYNELIATSCQFPYTATKACEAGISRDIALWYHS